MESLEYDGSGGAPTRVTRHVYDGNEVVAEYEVAGTQAPLAREFVWGEDFRDPVAMVVPSGASVQVYFYLTGPLGSVRALVDADGELVESYRYDPYGRVFARDAAGNPLTASTVGNPFTYTGQRYDWAVGLHHFKYRSYSPRLGRWMQRDPAGYADSANLYAYVRGAPTRLVDPLGLTSDDCPDDLMADIIDSLIDPWVEATEQISDLLNPEPTADADPEEEEDIVIPIVVVPTPGPGTPPVAQAGMGAALESLGVGALLGIVGTELVKWGVKNQVRTVATYAAYAVGGGYVLMAVGAVVTVWAIYEVFDSASSLLSPVNTAVPRTKVEDFENDPEGGMPVVK